MGADHIALIQLGSLFLHVATLDEIEIERPNVELKEGFSIDVHSIDVVTRSGAKCTRVTYKMRLLE